MIVAAVMALGCAFVAAVVLVLMKYDQAPAPEQDNQPGDYSDRS